MNAMKQPTMWETYTKKYLESDYMRKDKSPQQEESRYYVYDMMQRMAADGDVSMLDLGCGPGAVDTVAMNRIDGVTCTGMDTENILGHAKKNVPKGTPFVECDILRGLPSEEYDVVNIRHVLEHVPGYEVLLSEVFRIARKRVIITFFMPLGEDDHYHVLYGSRSFRNKYSKERFEEFLRVCGVWWDRRCLTTNVIYDIRV